MTRAFTLIEAMICVAIVAILAAMFIAAIVENKAAASAPPTPLAPATVESRSVVANSAGWPVEAKVMVLPTGERVLVAYHSRGVAVCLLPPIKEGKVEQ